jgi:L-threonylcarbamoyladenylate synthase
MGTRRRRVSVIYFISKLVKWDDLRMEIISNPTQVEIKNAAQALMDGHLVAFPTETVYGLGADATNEKAVSRVYSVKARPTDHPLIVHISSINQLGKWAIDIQEYAIKLAEEFWPGPMTLILKRSEIAKEFITGGQENVGIRVPSHPVALKLLSEFEKLGGVGIAAPSANRFGKISPTSSTDVQEDLGMYLEDTDQILDGGRSLVGIESTIVDCTAPNPIILRPGLISSKMIEELTTILVSADLNSKRIRVSGALEKHYSPKAKVRLGETAEPGEGFIAMANIKTPKGAIRLASPVNIEEFARYIYNNLRKADQSKLLNVVVHCPTGEGLEVALRDRLTRASNGN